MYFQTKPVSYSVAIIGLGNVGQLYDRNLPKDEFVHTHARAFSIHPSFYLISGIDPSPNLREIFEGNYAAKAYVDLEGMNDAETPDIFVVSSSTETHLSVIQEITGKYKPLAIVCEKPLAYRHDDALKIVELCHSSGIRLFVNYPRRADPGVIAVKKLLESNEIKKPVKAVVWYSKGLIHSGTHFMDMLNFWLGNVVSVSPISEPIRISVVDVEGDLQIEFEDGVAYFLVSTNPDLPHFSCELIDMNSRLRYENSGSITLEDRATGSVTKISAGSPKYQLNVADQLLLSLNGADSTLCTGEMGAVYIGLLSPFVASDIF
jgi:predicted dehydrogenase